MTFVTKLNETMARSPLHQWLGCSVESHDPASGQVRVALPARRELLRAPEGDAVHGGVIAALIDLAAHAALHSVTGIGMPTIDLRADFLRLAVAPLTAVATPRRVGRNVGIADVEVFDSSGELVALGRVVYRTARS